MIGMGAQSEEIPWGEGAPSQLYYENDALFAAVTVSWPIRGYGHREKCNWGSQALRLSYFLGFNFVSRMSKQKSG